MIFCHFLLKFLSASSACSEMLIFRPPGVMLFLSEALTNCKCETRLACLSFSTLRSFIMQLWVQWVSKRGWMSIRSCIRVQWVGHLNDTQFGSFILDYTIFWTQLLSISNIEDSYLISKSLCQLFIQKDSSWIQFGSYSTKISKFGVATLLGHLVELTGNIFPNVSGHWISW